MITVYFKQAWNLLRQEKLFSAIHIIGTGLSITIVMVLSIVFYIKIANIYPETNRDRMLVVKSVSELYGEDNSSSGSISLKLVDEFIRPVTDGVEAVSVMIDWDEEHYAQFPNNKEQLQIILQFVDVPFWTVFPFHFIAGKPFSEAEFESGIASVVVSASTAKRLLGRTDVVGEYISIDFKQYRISGVVKDASYATATTYANVWLPYTINPTYKESYGKGNNIGNMKAFILASSVADIGGIKEKIEARVEQHNRQEKEFSLNLNGQPDRYWQSTFRFWSNVGPNFRIITMQYSLLFLILLLVPAISLSGMTDSRMEKRLAEMGIRRAFGAPSGNLITQIISENFLFTLLGGLAGLLFSYVLILFSADWVMSIGENFVDLPPEGTKVLFTPSMLINLPVFFITLLICFLLNLLTAVIPAWRASRRNIIYSLNAKQ